MIFLIFSTSGVADFWRTRNGQLDDIFFTQKKFVYMEIKQNIDAAPEAQQALWRQVADTIESRIRAREFVPGDKLPTEAQFSEAFSVNRHTVRKALAYLQDKGLVESTQGRGSYVRRPALRYALGKRTRFTEALSTQSVNAATHTRRIDIRPAPTRVADALGLPPGAPTVFLDRVGFANNEPISLSKHFFDYQRFPTFQEMYNKHRSVTKTLLHSGVPDYTRKKTIVHARLPMPEEIELLNTPKHVPLLITQSWNVDGVGRPLEYGESAIASDRVELEIGEL